MGAGSISREYALHHFQVCPRTRVSAIVDLNEQRAAALARDVGSVQAGAAVANASGRGYSAAPIETRGVPVACGTALTAELLVACDMVYIGTTPASHADIVLDALAAGKHVLLEKPLAATATQADAIVAAAEKAAAQGLRLGMDIGMRWNAALLEMRRIAITAGDLGPLIRGRLSLHFPQWPRPWQVQPWCAGRAEGGALREVGTHWFFGLMELFGHECVQRVRCTVTYPAADNEGTAAESAADGTLVLRNGLALALSLRCDGGGLAVDGTDHYVLRLEGERGELELFGFTSLRQTAPPADAALLVDGAGYGRGECITALLTAVDGGEGGGISAREGRNAQRILDAVVASHGEWLEVEYD